MMMLMVDDNDNNNNDDMGVIQSIAPCGFAIDWEFLLGLLLGY